METRRIGSLQVSVVGVGCNNFGSRIDYAATERVVHAALDAGVNFFDTADIYGKTQSEQFLGRALGARRHEVVVATKFGMAVDDQRKGARPHYIRSAVEDSLRRLGTDYIDLYQLHQPDATVPVADTLGALDDLVQAGKVREIGCSNFDAAQLRAAAAAVRPGAARFMSVQNEYSLVHREPERGVLDECARQGVAFLPYYPLAAGLLTGKYRRGRDVPAGTRLHDGRYASWLSDQNLDAVERLAAFAEARGHTILDLAFAWLLAKRVVASVIAGATKPEQLRANVHAGAWRMSAEEVNQLDELLRSLGERTTSPAPVPASAPAPPR